MGLYQKVSSAVQTECVQMASEVRAAFEAGSLERSQAWTAAVADAPSASTANAFFPFLVDTSAELALRPGTESDYRWLEESTFEKHFKAISIVRRGDPSILTQYQQRLVLVFIIVIQVNNLTFYM